MKKKTPGALGKTPGATLVQARWTDAGRRGQPEVSPAPWSVRSVLAMSVAVSAVAMTVEAEAADAEA